LVLAGYNLSFIHLTLKDTRYGAGADIVSLTEFNDQQHVAGAVFGLLRADALLTAAAAATADGFQIVGEGTDMAAQLPCQWL
jgi:hypothetical protein